MKKIPLVLYILFTVAVSFSSFGVASAATCTVKEADGSTREVETSFDLGCGSGGETAVGDILILGINILSAGVGIAIVGGIVWAGLKYASSSSGVTKSDVSKTKEAKDMILNSVIALFLFIFLFTGINFLVPGGLFN